LPAGWARTPEAVSNGPAISDNAASIGSKKRFRPDMDSLIAVAKAAERFRAFAARWRSLFQSLQGLYPIAAEWSLNDEVCLREMAKKRPWRNRRNGSPTGMSAQRQSLDRMTFFRIG
jgi:hypothetical protein